MKKLRRNKYEVHTRDRPVMEIIWLDHCGSSRWENYDQDNNKLLVCHSVGYLVDETQDTIILSQSYGQPPALPWNGLHVIGKALIISKRIISKKGK